MHYLRYKKIGRRTDEKISTRELLYSADATVVEPVAYVRNKKSWTLKTVLDTISNRQWFSDYSSSLHYVFHVSFFRTHTVANFRGLLDLIRALRSEVKCCSISKY